MNEQKIAGLRANNFREDCYVRVQTYVDDWGEMIATGPVGGTIINGTVPQTIGPSTGQSGNSYVGFTFNSSGTPTVANIFTNFSSSSAVE